MTTRCPHCDKALDGYLVRGEVLTADDLIAFFSNRPSRETVNAWLSPRGWLHGFQVPGVRGNLITVDDFRSRLESQKRRRASERAVASHLANATAKEKRNA